MSPLLCSYILSIPDAVSDLLQPWIPGLAVGVDELLLQRELRVQARHHAVTRTNMTRSNTSDCATSSVPAVLSRVPSAVARAVLDTESMGGDLVYGSFVSITAAIVETSASAELQPLSSLVGMAGVHELRFKVLPWWCCDKLERRRVAERSSVCSRELIDVSRGADGERRDNEYRKLHSVVHGEVRRGEGMRAGVPSLPR